MATFVRTQQISHVIGPVGVLELRVRSADVRVRAVDGGEARVTATFEIRATSDADADRIYEQSLLRVEEAGDVLRVSEPRVRTGLADALGRALGGGDRAALGVEVELPTGAGLGIETVSGNVQATGLRGRQRYQTVSGDLFLTELGGPVLVTTVSGDAVIRGAEPLEVRSEAISGDLGLSAPLVRRVVATSVSGDISIEGELSPAGEFRVETVSGDLSVGLLGSAEFDVRGLATDISCDIAHRLEGRLDRRRVVIGSGVPTFTFHSMSGDLSIRRPRRTERRTGPTVVPAAPANGQARPSRQLEALRALERGEIDVDEAMRRIGGDSTDG